MMTSKWLVYDQDNKVVMVTTNETQAKNFAKSVAGRVELAQDSKLPTKEEVTQ
jgi:hypothetical protein